MELLHVLALALPGLDWLDADNLDGAGPGAVAGAELAVHCGDGGGGAEGAVFAVHIVCAGARVVADAAQGGGLANVRSVLRVDMQM